MMFNFKAVIFDMDGLLLDTERIAMETFVLTCHDFDFDPDMDVYRTCIGTNLQKTREILCRGYGPDFRYDDISKIWGEKYISAVSEKPIPLKTGARDLLEFFKRSHIKKAVATSTEHDMAIQKLQRTGLRSYFDTVVGGNQVKNGKPDPEIYLKVSELIAVKPGDCLVLEDSDNGVLAAYKAGMHVIQIPDLKEPSPEISALGHVILHSLNDVKDLLED